ncbi:hypothetical protein WHR41_01730 [Cladosporium halotolerans]|uniref:Gag1-like clamp domain-containing protein n=1 Tax=Cladosporium halotolerans TaxID=1052096 RepID=A0AB34KWT1_9PEZI
MTLHLGLHHHRNADQQAEIREARRMLQGRVRTDWHYPSLPAYQKEEQGREPAQTEDEARVAGFKFHTPGENEPSEPLEWRERDYASSDNDSDEDEAEIAAVRESEQKKGKGEHSSETAHNIAANIANRRNARKRKRKELLEREMTWNDGLSHWTAMRDAWCGAKTADEVRALKDGQVEDVKADSASASASAGSTPRTSTSSGSAKANSTSAAATTPDANIHVGGMSVSPPSHMLVPVAPKILPNHPIRRKISPGMYSEIYNKIIIQSRTPSVPINLGTMINALVQGWKDDGEWPPKPAPLEKSITKKKGHGSVRDGVKSFARVLRITGGESVAGKG